MPVVIVHGFNLYLATLGQTAAKEALRRQEENAAKLSEAASEREQLKKEMVSWSCSFSAISYCALEHK